LSIELSIDLKVDGNEKRRGVGKEAINLYGILMIGDYF
jgi:hypothetical protein